MKIEHFYDNFLRKLVLSFKLKRYSKSNFIFVISMVNLVGIDVHMSYTHNMKSQL